MTVAEFIDWLKTQDQMRIVEVLVERDLDGWDTVTDWEYFDPVLHSSDFFDGILQLGDNDD